MEKLKIYNQFLLASIGTLALLFGFVGFIYLVFEVWSHSTYESPKPQILAEDQAKKMAADSVRKQIISFREADIIDTNRLYYLIPIGQAQLDKAELYGLSNRNKSHYLDSDDNNTPTYNNILFYNAAANTTQTLFKKRVSINYYGKYHLSNRVLTHFSVTDADSDRDGFMSRNDLQKLYIFLPESGRLLEIEARDKTYYSLQRLGKTDDFLVKYGLDRNKNGRFDPTNEPYVFYRLNITEGKLNEIIPDTLTEQLQRRLDGQDN